jgi:hypothetical protein
LTSVTGSGISFNIRNPYVAIYMSIATYGISHQDGTKLTLKRGWLFERPLKNISYFD